MKSSRVSVSSHLVTLLGTTAAVIGIGSGVAMAQDGAAPTAPATPTTPAAAQPVAAPAPATGADGWCVLTGDNVYVRVAPDTQLGYPFAKLDKGAVVKVVERENGWARVVAEGPSFMGGTAYVLADSRAALSQDGKSLTVTKQSPVLAPDILRANDPSSAWKVIASIKEGATVDVIDVQKVGGKQYVRITLPTLAEGWVSETFLANATAGDVTAAINRATAGAAAASGDAASTEPTTPATPDGATAMDGATATDGSTATGGASAPTDGATTAAAEEGSASEETDPRFQPKGPSPEQLARETSLQSFKDLEAIWISVREQPIETEELAALGARYELLIVEVAEQPSLLLQAKARAEQIRIRTDLQDRILALASLRAEMTREQEEVKAVALAIEARSDFNVVGTLNASIVYDGERLPLLYRVQDASTGATVAYVQPQEGITADTLATMLGTLIGIKGDVSFDPSLGVNVVKPRAIEALTAKATSVPSDPAAPAAASTTE